MQTTFSSKLLETVDGQEANRILRSCVHCGFCIATCPTYLLTGNELDSPRGRIYLIKNMLEEGKATAITRTHLDRCLSCQSCETTCPSSVDYHGLLNIGRRVLEKKSRRPFRLRLKAWGLRKTLQTRWLLHFLLACGRSIRALLPASFARLLKPARGRPWADQTHTRKMLILNGCVQPGLSPETNIAASHIFSRLGIQLVTAKEEGCCGALAFHLDAQKEGLAKAKRKIDVLCAQLDSGVEAIVSTASGCGNFIDQYASLFAKDDQYAAKAARVKQATKDIGQLLLHEDLSKLTLKSGKKISYHCPCTLQHGLKENGTTKELLTKIGLTLTTPKDSHLCCGSAGAYSVMQPQISNKLRDNKLEQLMVAEPETIVTSNIGCQLHLARKAEVPVVHWVQLLDELTSNT